MNENIYDKVAEYFEKFARQGLRPGAGHTFITTIEYQTQVENQFVTADFERDKALRYMEEQGWMEMPGGRVAFLTEAGFNEMQRRHPSV